MAHLVEKLPAVWETWLDPWLGRSAGEGKATYSSMQAWRVPSGLYSPGPKSQHTERLSLSFACVPPLSTELDDGEGALLTALGIPEAGHSQSVYWGAHWPQACLPEVEYDLLLIFDFSV